MGYKKILTMSKGEWTAWPRGIRPPASLSHIQCSYPPSSPHHGKRCCDKSERYASAQYSFADSPEAMNLKKISLCHLSQLLEPSSSWSSSRTYLSVRGLLLVLVILPDVT